MFQQRRDGPDFFDPGPRFMDDLVEPRAIAGQRAERLAELLTDHAGELILEMLPLAQLERHGVDGCRHDANRHELVRSGIEPPGADSLCVSMGACAIFPLEPEGRCANPVLTSCAARSTC